MTWHDAQYVNFYYKQTKYINYTKSLPVIFYANKRKPEFEIKRNGKIDGQKYAKIKNLKTNRVEMFLVEASHRF